MPDKKRLLGRREFLGLSAAVTGAIALSACGAPPSEPAPAAKATVPPAAGATPAGKAPAAPPAAAAADKPGRHLIGKLEGPEIILDPAKWPKKFKEAPKLAELVKTGKLPPVEQRIPEEPMVIKPLHEIGKYGGTWRRGFTGPGDGENGARIVSSDRLLYSDYTGTKVMANVAKDFKMSADGKTFTIYLRKGLKWSDGEPFDADDIMFWFNDFYSNKEIRQTPISEMTINGKEGTLEKIDQYTVAFKFPEPYFAFEQSFGGDSNVGAGFATGGSTYGGFLGGYAPAHYLKNYHPTYASKEKLDAEIKKGGFDNWLTLMRFKMDFQRNPELPVLGPWKTTTPITTPTWVLERNPYFWAVDTEGNQLPYIDSIVMTLAENLEVLNLRAVAGEYDMQSRHIDMGKIPVLLENQKKGNYTVRLDPGDYGADAVLFPNTSYDADPEVAKWINNADFRRALSMGIERDQLNEAFWLGLGTPGSVVVSEEYPENPGPEYRKLWSTYDTKKANELLDKAGLDKKDGDGFRLRTDGKGRLRIELSTPGAAFVPLTQIAEMIAEHWKKIGVQADVLEMERSLWQKRVIANELPLTLRWGNTGTEIPFISIWTIVPTHSRVEEGPLHGVWYASNGKSGKKPNDPLLIKAMDMYRGAFNLKDEERIKVAQELWKMHVDQQWTIGTVGLGPAIIGTRVVKNNMGNVPERFSLNRNTRTPGATHPSTYYFKS